ncbi:hypothetical protein VT84_33765 [Gemmata sp. SH-PL17]|uniref:hypothetical protein n=1 Tax=Gemmata sp. SH-PL17 TaxID=1630693 RepID=UPI000697B9A7|nr:hypothetical protein [Gemmata sp. SH-PL17]AMV29411.1 hypothetical protein VT84_33765 [Gemmata sp. SH-PL17]
MRRSRDSTGALLIVCGIACLVAGFAFIGEGPAGSVRALIVGGGLVVFWGIRLIARIRVDDGTGELVQTVQMLRPLVGRSEADVRKWLGAPHSSICISDGWDLTWDAPRYSVTLRFRDGVCQGLVKEGARTFESAR